MKTRSKSTIAGLAMAACLVVAAVPASADSIDLSSMKVSLDAPKPWPLKNLIEPGKIVIATSGQTEKESFVGDNGELQGALIDLWTKMADDLGLKPEFAKVEWPGVIPGLVANRFDLGCEGALWTNARLSSQDFFLTRPIQVQVNVAMVRKDSGIQSYADMAGKKLGGVKGEVELQSLLTKLNASPDGVLSLPGISEARLALLNKQMDVYGTGLHIAAAAMEGPDGDKFTILPEPTSVGVASFCVNHREADLLNAVNFLIARYRSDGTMKAINEKWGVPDTSGLLSKLAY
ncbi:amino acid ABC transporter substrate-binding protein [Kaistia sp. 32K]|uniref:substrate-binding periplasmic protein n=1 Tax=Kaistia sp. 32K TaxID=2795690 RepID=UPI001916A9E2|nr:transporter substrate-binding domain-containing protein [Kaistia sp. 32K]BCP52375.1 amino acid ABC transporter substrate-binding protein [Kaistia sp. 32K]